MPKSRARIRNPNRKPLPPSPRPIRSKFLRRVGRGVSAGVVLLGLIASVDQIWGPPWPTQLDFDPGPPDASLPFDVPFTVRNRSTVFDATAVQLGCLLEKVEFRNGGRLIDDLVVGTGPTEIARGDQRPFRCWFPFEPQQVKVAVMRIIASYDHHRLFGWRTQMRSEPFVWDTKATPARWVKGNPIGPT